MDFAAVDRAPLYRRIAGSIRESILQGDIGPGELLPTEKDLSERFGVSRASVREALRQLEAQGLLAPARQAQGRVVATGEGVESVRDALANVLALRQVSLADLVELRCAVEGAALRKVTTELSPAALSDAEAALDIMRAPSVSIDAFDKADIRFHTALVAAAGNQALHAVMLSAREALTNHLHKALQRRPDRRDVFKQLLAEHEAILAAVRSGDGPQAAALTEQHVRSFYGV
jgi:DNA-binding FadR family transcriptional regulator